MKAWLLLFILSTVVFAGDNCGNKICNYDESVASCPTDCSPDLVISEKHASALLWPNTQVKYTVTIFNGKNTDIATNVFCVNYDNVSCQLVSFDRQITLIPGENSLDVVVNVSDRIDKYKFGIELSTSQNTENMIYEGSTPNAIQKDFFNGYVFIPKTDTKVAYWQLTLAILLLSMLILIIYIMFFRK
jgi:hypothetical protein